MARCQVDGPEIPGRHWWGPHLGCGEIHELRRGHGSSDARASPLGRLAGNGWNGETGYRVGTDDLGQILGTIFYGKSGGD